LIEKYEEVFKEELNVKKVTLSKSSEELVNYTLKPNFKILAPKVKSAVKEIGKELEKLDTNRTREFVEMIAKGESIVIRADGAEYELTPEDLEYRIEVHEGFAGEEAEGYLLLFNSTITDELKQEGYVRDIIRRVQTMRKELDLEYTQNIVLSVDVDEFGKEALKKFEDYIKEETLSKEMEFTKPKEGLVKDWKFDEFEVTIGVKPL
jgi:isoleucyl-tRNA synthetase